MKKKVFLLMGIFTIGISVLAQVGINTQNPLGVFHVDPKANTNTAGTSGTDDDVIVKADGKVGLGTVNPTKTLDVRGKFKLVDGTQGDGKFLTSDANGFGSWKANIANKTFIFGTRKFPLLTSTTPVYTGSSITLTAGTWMIAYTCTYQDSSIANYIIWRLSTSGSSLVPYLNGAKSTAYSCSVPGGYHTSVSSYFLVKNIVSQTYYIWAGLKTNSSTIKYTGEGAFYAIPLS